MTLGPPADATVSPPVRSSARQLFGSGGFDVNTSHEYPARGNGARVGIIIAIVAVLAIIAAFAFGLIDISQTREAKAPEVSVQGGQAPAFDVDTATVDVGTRTEGVTVPKVEVGTTETEIKVPTVDVNKAN